MSAETTAKPRYGPALALRHLWRGAIAPREAMREALRARIAEPARLVLLLLVVLALGLVDPETRALGRAAIENASDDTSRIHGLLLLALGAVVIGLAILVVYWIAALVVHALSWPKWSRASVARSRSVVVLSAWFSLLPTIVVKLLALAILPASMVAADPPSLYTALELVIGVPYFAACLMEAFGRGLGRAAITATLVNGAFYLVILLVYLVAPAE